MDMELEVRLGWYETSFYGTRTSSFKYRYEILFYRTSPESLMSHMQFIFYLYGTLFYGNIVSDGSYIRQLQIDWWVIYLILELNEFNQIIDIKHPVLTCIKFLKMLQPSTYKYWVNQIYIQLEIFKECDSKY